MEELHRGHPRVVRVNAPAIRWPGISKDLEQSCPRCQQSRNVPPPAPWEWPREPWARLHPFAGPFQGRMFLVLVDAYTKWLEVLPMSSTTTAATVEKVRHIFAVHGLPQRIVTNNGPQFTSREFAEFLEGNGVVHVRVAPYHTPSNRLVESGKGRADLQVWSSKDPHRVTRGKIVGSCSHTESPRTQQRDNRTRNPEVESRRPIP